MTQKPPEMPQEIWVNQDAKGTYWLDHNPDPKGEINRSDTRYILAAPKEDVERALEYINERIQNCMDAIETSGGDETYKKDLMCLETIRRVLLANAGRKE